VNVGLSFLKGMVASINPCGFVLLPTYLLYFLGLEATAGTTQRSSVGRALAVSAAVSSGFIGVFLVAGVIAEFFTTWLTRNAQYVTLVMGVALIVLGAAMLFGYRLPFTAPSVGGGTDRSVRAMWLYGVGYALASLGCTIGLFVGTVFDSPDSFSGGVVNAAAYALGMGLVVTALTVSLAVANQGLTRVLRSASRHVDAVAAAFVLLSGVYLVYYFWVVDVNEDATSVTGAVERVQTWVLVRVNDHWELVAVVLGAIVAAAVVYVLRRRPRPGAAVPSSGT